MKEITIFSKRRQTAEGRVFYTYITTLPKKDGSTQTMGVKFRDECGAPKPEKCPMNIVVEREHMNISQKSYTDNESGEIGISYTLWVSAWTEGTKYVDHSLDDFDI